MNLRPYQKETLIAIKKKYVRGEHKQVIVYATGLGKTVVFSQLISDMTTYFKKKALVLAHREELLTQARDKMLAINPALKIGIEMADQSVDPTDDIIVASVASIGRSGSDRIKKFDPADFCLVVIDEAHHASADTYRNVLSHFDILKDEKDTNAAILLLGVTATPSRNDNKGIDKVFNEVVYEMDIIDGIQQGFLSRIKAYRVDTRTDISQVGKVGADFNQGELADAVNNPERNNLIVKAYKERVPGKQALVFAADVAHTHALTQAFIDAGITASFVTGALDKDERRLRLKNFYDKKIQVMVNAMVLTEGYDNEFIEAVLMARPTQSGILFQQMIGRGTRISPGKTHLTIIDFVDNTFRQNLQTTASLLGIPGTLDFKGKDVLEVKDDIDKLLELAPNTNLDKFDINRIQYAIEEVDILSGLKVPEELTELTTFDWHRYMDDHYQISLPEKRSIHVEKSMTGQWIIRDTHYDMTKRTEMHESVGSAKELDAAIDQADLYISTKYPDYGTLVSTSSRWRKLPISMQQAGLLEKLGVSHKVIGDLDKGTASRLITKLLTYKKRDQKPRFAGK